MIINSIIAGAQAAGVEIHHQTFYPTSEMTQADFFSTYDIRFHYKNSMLFVYVADYNASGLSTKTRLKFICIANVTNYTQDYYNWYISKSQNSFNWYQMIYNGTKGYMAHNAYSADASTGRISYVGTGTAVIADNGTSVSVWEIPLSANNSSDNTIDITPWGTT